LPAADVRALLRLVGELRELGTEPAHWRTHLVGSLAHLCGTRAVLAGELQARSHRREDSTVVHREYHGVPLDQQAAFDEVVWLTHGPNEVLPGNWSSYRALSTVSRQQLVGDRAWYRSRVANDHFRAAGADDFIVAMIPVDALRVMGALKLFRPWGDRPFGDRDRLLVSLLTEELAHDWSIAAQAAAPALNRRLRQVLDHLAAGSSEKEIASALSISTHTVHDYTKALHRTFRVHSRTELLAKIAPPRRPRTHLTSESLRPPSPPRA
jgi:DNA-binding CsgD family transcriptional regulator